MAYSDFITNTIYGMALSPEVYKTMRQDDPANKLYFPVIVDPRLGAISEMFYSPTLWEARVKEQNEWDASTKPADERWLEEKRRLDQLQYHRDLMLEDIMEERYADLAEKA